MIETLFEEKYPDELEKFLLLKEQFGIGWETLNDAVLRKKLPSSLTEREREVAKLAAAGLRNSEIARELFVSESTVRAHLRVVFQKLNIDRRAKLTEMLG